MNRFLIQLTACVAIASLWGCSPGSGSKGGDFDSITSNTDSIADDTDSARFENETDTNIQTDADDDTDTVQTLSFEERATALVSQMTLAEKVSQLGHRAPDISRLDIPKHNWWNEALHGVARSGIATVFPQSIALAGTFDVELMHTVADVISTEARVKHNEDGKALTYWSPTVNLARDPRWGRNEETYGEDPFLASRMAVAFVKGMQGDDPTYIKTVSTPKHFIANNEEIRRHTGSSDVDERNLREFYMPAFEAAVVEGGAMSVMCAYNALNGIPACANSWLLKDVLRDKWGFTGYVVSDCGAVADIVDNHNYVASDIDASVAAITAGTDLNCGSRYQRDLQEAVENEVISEDVLDTALVRLFSARYRLGLFDDAEDVPFYAISPDSLDSPSHQALALDVAQKSMALLKNDGILPLDAEKLNSVAVIGPHADAIVFGGYSGDASNPISPFDGIEERLASSGVTVSYAPGSTLTGVIDDDALAEAVALAEAADVAIAVVGTDLSIANEEQDRTDITLPMPQEALLQAVFEANRNTIAVLVTGAPLAIEWANDNLPAILNAWYGGQAAGEAIAAILFGDVNPSGRLPQTFYRSVTDLPPFDDYDIIGQKRTYMFFDGDVLYPFGHGLSYTTFNYSDIALSAKTVSVEDVVTVSVDVTNSGAMDGDEVVQVYVHDVESAVPSALKKLKGFQRVAIRHGETETVSIDLKVSDFGFYNVAEKKFVVEPGEFEIQVGASSADIRASATLTVE
ncbi:MAG: glycoside hydrolase family 3 C-terminal domain-containing protein [Deltaproteobacteria bacterium]|nr:glycoside hydrolase family 3 C-terminal domain-containing protein [Deltaproteobacteria bacterium]